MEKYLTKILSTLVKWVKLYIFGKLIKTILKGLGYLFRSAFGIVLIAIALVAGYFFIEFMFSNGIENAKQAFDRALESFSNLGK